MADGSVKVVGLIGYFYVVKVVTEIVYRTLSHGDTGLNREQTRTKKAQTIQQISSGVVDCL